MKINQKLVSVPKIFMNIWFIVVSIFCIIPMVFVIAISFSDEMDIARYGYRLIPRTISIIAYKYIFSNPKQILNSYMITIIVTIVGTLISLILTAMLAYTLSRRDYRYKKVTSLYIFVTMLFNGGLVPWYILITSYLHLKNTLLVLFLPYTIVPWFVLLMKGFLASIPASIYESAKIDGAKELKIFFNIVLPLSKPALATVGLFSLLMYWNDWWLSLLFIDEEKLIPLQYMLYRIMSNIEFLTNQMGTVNVSINIRELPNESARMAMCVLAAGPMLFAFPFFQKYFIKGLTVGSIKG